MLLQIVMVGINDFKTEAVNDYLNIYDGNNTSSRLLGSLNGTCLFESYSRLEFYSTQAFLLIHFHSDNSTQDKGFRASLAETNGNCWIVFYSVS
jgi:hypothetical protein